MSKLTEKCYSVVEFLQNKKFVVREEVKDLCGQRLITLTKDDVTIIVSTDTIENIVKVQMWKKEEYTSVILKDSFDKLSKLF